MTNSFQTSLFEDLIKREVPKFSLNWFGNRVIGGAANTKDLVDLAETLSFYLKEWS